MKVLLALAEEDIDFYKDHPIIHKPKVNNFKVLANGEIYCRNPNRSQKRKSVKNMFYIGLGFRLLVFTAILLIIFLWILTENNVYYRYFNSYSLTKKIGSLLMPIGAIILMVSMLVEFIRQNSFSEKEIPLWEELRITPEGITISSKHFDESFFISPKNIKKILLEYEKPKDEYYDKNHFLFLRIKTKKEGAYNFKSIVTSEEPEEIIYVKEILDNYFIDNFNIRIDEPLFSNVEKLLTFLLVVIIIAGIVLLSA
jgi:hypothetical protein